MSRALQAGCLYPRPQFSRGLTVCATRGGYKATTKAMIVWRPHLP